MGLVLFIIISPIILAFVLGLKGDEWFNHKPPRQKHYYYYDEYDDFDEDDYRPSHVEEHHTSGSSDSGLYGGLPYGDGQIYIVDNEDMIDQMDF